MTRVTDILDVLEAHGRLTVGQTRTFGVWLPEEIWQKRLHTRASKQSRRVILEDEGRRRDDFMSVLNLKI